MFGEEFNLEEELKKIPEYEVAVSAMSTLIRMLHKSNMRIAIFDGATHREAFIIALEAGKRFKAENGLERSPVMRFIVEPKAGYRAVLN